MRTQNLVNGVETAAEVFCRAVIGQAHNMDGLPYILNYAPLAQVNPFQNLLYCGAKTAGYATVPAVAFEDLAPVCWRGRGVIHLHWLASILKGIESTDHAEEKIKEFERNLCQWKGKGYKIVWTMHNVLPHNSVLISAEIALRKLVIQYSDCIHILAKSSIYEAKQYYDIPDEKVIYVPHPSYQGWYANMEDPQYARLELGVEPDEFTFVQFGALQRYKGVLELVDAFRQLQSKYTSKKLRLIVAGMPSDKQYVAEVLDMIAATPEIRLIQTSVVERDIQILANAADVMVAPYIKTLNSGVAMLAVCFKKSLIAPSAGGVAELFKNDSTLLYNVEESTGLLNAMEKALTYKVAESVFTSILEAYKPALISEQFFKALNDKLFSAINNE